MGYLAAWLLSYYQALTAEDHKIWLAVPDLETREMVKQLPGGLALLCCERLVSEILMGFSRNAHVFLTSIRSHRALPESTRMGTLL